ncbi:MAG: DUF305 domain-containing protein [Pseudonocardiaceae bacterium]|nr:DUF305 domain-containing protein [Pseudonocardiaceae bacterium]
MTTESGSPARGPAWMRVVIVTGAVLAVLLLGASAGLLLGQRGEPAAEPGLDSVSVGFAQDMSVHHRQAALMGALVPTRSTDPAIRPLAFDIQTTQLEQIGRMQGWLSLWDAPALPPGGHMTWMSGHGHGGGGVETMPGMASPQELDVLRRASGPEFDVMFLQLMLRHHQGGVPMLRHAQQHAEVPQVRNLAGQMLSAQLKESDYMTRLLAERGAQPLPPPT